MGTIRIRGARTHNLTGLDLDLPLGTLTVVTGVSGSGKSSLVFDTLHAEGRRRYLEALDARQGGLRRPPVDAVDGLPPTVALRQHTRAPGRRDTLADVTELSDVLAVLFARAGVQHDPESGEAIRPTPHDRMVAELLELPEGTRLLLEAPLLPEPGADLAGLLDEVRRAGFSRVRLHGSVFRLEEAPTARFDPDVRVVVDRIRVSAERRPRIAEALRTAGAAGRGVIVAVLPDGERTYVDRPFSLSTRRTFPDLTPGLFSRRGAHACEVCEGSREVGERTCAACAGSGLGEAARHVRYRGRTLVEVLGGTVSEVRAWLSEQAGDPAVRPVLHDLHGRLGALERLALGGEPLDRRAPALSGGAWRRVRLARLLGQPLSGVVYLLDEPTAGLAEDVVEPVLEVIEGLVERGNTVVCVSHRRALVDRARHLVDLGPGAGPEGGRLVYAGPAPGLPLDGDTPTARWLSGRLPEPEASAPVPGSGQALVVRGLTGRGLGPLDIRVSPGELVAVRGPSGAGRSSLLEALDDAVSERAGDFDARSVQPGGFDRALRVNDGRVGSTRSMVATFVGLWDTLRELLSATTEAKIRGLTASTFSLATKGGRCETCRGQGEVKVDLGLLPPVWLPCETCEGRRFQEDVLDIRWKGRHAGQLLDLTAREAHPLLAGHPRLERALRALDDVGLGYVPLGQTTADLSGGEAARLRLARELSRSRRGVEGALVLVDDPTAGLHPADALGVLRLLQTLAGAGAGVVAATTDPAVPGVAHTCIDLSTGSGSGR